jgi:hypothetical protein
MVCFAIDALAVDVLYNGRDPHGVKSEPLNVVEVRRDAVPRPAAVLAVACVALRRYVVCTREPVRHQLRDGQYEYYGGYIHECSGVPGIWLGFSTAQLSRPTSTLRKSIKPAKAGGQRTTWW